MCTRNSRDTVSKWRLANDADERISIDKGGEGQGETWEGQQGKGAPVVAVLREPACKERDEADGLTDGGSPTNGLSANC